MVKKLLSLTLMALIFSPLAVYAQNAMLKGKVTDSSTGEVLPGANVLIQELSRGTATGIDGTYTIENLPAGEFTVVASYVGYKDSKVTVTLRSGENVLNIEVSPDFLGLDEVVVTGYGEVDKRTVTSSISKVSREDIQDIPAVSPDMLIQGQAAGVQVTASSGTPGGGISVRVRGATSISASNEPLYVVDGVPLSSGNFTQIGVGNQGMNTLANLAPQDIESIEVLKDASATAVFGARGANGVVLITTKRGKAGKSNINFGYSYGVKDFANELEFLDSPEFMNVYMEGMYRDYIGAPVDATTGELLPFPSGEEMLTAFVNGFGGTPSDFFGTFNNAFNDYGSDFSQAPTTDWQDAVFQQGVVQTYNFSAEGGDPKTRYYFSSNYYDEEGIMANSGFSRLNGRLNLDHQINERASLSSSINYTRSEANRIENDNNIFGVLTNAYLSNPTAPIRNDDGSFNNNVGFAFSNPVAESEVQNDVITYHIVANTTFDYEPVDNLVFKALLGLDRFDINERQFVPSFTNQGAPEGSANDGVTFNQTWLMEYSASYRTTFNDVHNLDFLGVLSYQETELNRSFSSGTNFPSDELRTIASAAITTGFSSGTSFGIQSFTNRINYNYDQKYLVTLASRYDGSSRFGEDSRWGFFPSASVGWRVSEESFLKDSEAINDLKFRFSYGITGNQEIGNFNSLGLFGSTAYNGRPALFASQLPNPDLQWEETTQMNVGVDFTILKERISGTVDYYTKSTENLLLNLPLPASTGFTGVTSNVGSIDNWGIEFMINTVNIRTKDFQWTSSFNIAQNRNEVTSIVNDNPFSTGFASRVQVGEPLGSFYGFVTDGLWNTQAEIDEYLAGDPNRSVGNAEPGDIRYVDLNGDGIINGEDQQIIGDANPDWLGGFRNVFTFKGFELNAFFQFVLGNDIYNNNRGFYEAPGFAYAHTASVRDRWTPTNTDGSVYRSSWFDNNNNRRDSDYYIEDGSFLRLKNLTLAYTFNRAQLEKVGLTSLRVYTTGYNLLTWTDYSGPDPEVNTFDGSNTSLGTDFFVFPQSRSIVFGVNLGF